MAEIRLKIAEKEKLRCMVEIVNTLFHLTKTEIDILVAFLEHDKTVACSKEARKLVAEKLGITSIAIINNHVKALKDKKAIHKQERYYAYHPMLRFPEQESRIVFLIETV